MLRTEASSIRTLFTGFRTLLRSPGWNKAVLGLAMACLFVGCPEPHDPPSEGQVVIRVDDRVMTLSEFEEHFEQVKMYYDDEGLQDSATMQAARIELLMQLVEEIILLRRADELGLEVSAAEVDAVLQDSQEGRSGKGLEEMFLKHAVSSGTWKERLRKRLLVQKVIETELSTDTVVTSQEIEDYYIRHGQESNRGEEVRVRQIVVPTESQAKDIVGRLKDGEDFGTLCRSYSVGPEAREGGDLGYVFRGKLPSSLEEAFFDLDVGVISPVIQTPFGFHIFQVTERVEARKPDAEASIDRIKEGIRKERMDAAYGPWLAKLRSRYRITMNEGII